MSKKLWCFAVLLMLAGGLVFSLGYLSGKKSGIAEITEIVLAEQLKEQSKVDQALKGAGGRL